MLKNTKYFFYATATWIGFIVGAGIFGLPFIMKNLGYSLAVLLLLILAAFTIVNILSLMEITLRTRGNHFFPGLAEVYLGKFGKWFQFVSITTGNYGALLAYLILGSTFLGNLLNSWIPLNNSFFIFLFLILSIFFIWHGVEELGFIEFILLLMLLGIVVLITFKSAPQIELKNYLGLNLGKVLPAFGVFIFALDGTGCVFTIRQILKRREKLIKKATFLTYAAVLLIFLIFTASLIGIFGESVNQEAVVGIGEKLGRDVEYAAVIFGFLAVFSSFLVIGSTLKNTLAIDFKIPHSWSWLLVWIIPLALYFLGFNNFIAIISLVGVIFGTLNTVTIALMLKKARKQKRRKPELKLELPIWVNYLIAFLYFIAMTYEISRFF